MSAETAMILDRRLLLPRPCAVEGAAAVVYMLIRGRGRGGSVSVGPNSLL